MTQGAVPYTEEELELLLGSAAVVLVAAVSADRSGPVAYFEEMTAAGTFLYEARERYPGNALVEELYQRNQELSLDEDEGRVTREMLLERISEVDSVLRRDEEGLEFRRFLYDLAHHIARASRAGFLGPRISEGEARFLSDLRSRLGLPDGD